MRAKAAVLLVAAIGATQCVDVQPFVCAGPDDCRRGDERGLCEATGHCSYEDDTCPSGRRYSDLAGALANACTESNDATSTTMLPGEADASVSSSSVDASSANASSSGSVPLCGDGVLDPDEECDDGNDRDGDGCNASCVRSGALLWSHAVAGSAGLLDSGQSIAMLASGDAVVVGWMHDAKTGEDVWVSRWRPDGEQVWSRTYGNPSANDRGFGVTQASSADVFVGGFVRENGSRRAWVGLVSPDGETVAEVRLTGQEVQALSAFNNRIVAVGHRAGGAFVEALQLQGESVWRVETNEANDIFYAIHTTSTESAYVAGRTMGDAWLALATPTGITTIDARDGPASEVDWAQAVLAVGDRVVTAGLLVGELAGDIWIGGYDPSIVGPPVWEFERCGEANEVQEEAEALAIAPDGDLVAAGFSTLDDRDAWIARLTLKGECVWERTYPEIEGDSTARGLAIGPDGTMWVTGDVSGPDGTIDAWVAAFSP